MDRRRLLAAAAALAVAACSAPAVHVPEPGQAGKDVIWLPTPDSLVEKMLDLAELRKSDSLVDLGSGDGRTVIAAARRGARARGIEYDAGLVELSRRHAQEAGVDASFEQGDIFQSDFSDATVVTLFLLTNLNVKLRPTLLDMRPGTRIVSNTFRMGEWQPDREITTGCGAFCTAYLWIVPAKVDGYWSAERATKRGTEREEIALTQEFQKLFGTVKSGGSSASILEGRLSGSDIEFRIAGADYRGVVKGNAIEGTVTRGGATSAWRAERKRL